jgi:hypothetical protein
MIFSVVGIPDDEGFSEGTIGGVVVRKFLFRDFSFCFFIVGAGFGVIGWFEEVAHAKKRVGMNVSSFMTTSMGVVDCPCVDAIAYGAALEACNVSDSNERGYWRYSDSRTGVSTCYPPSHGSQYCEAHDMIADPLCSSPSENKNNPPAYCQEKWCYVDAQKCQKSYELYHKSVFPPFREEHLFYSYSTCNSSNDAFEEYSTFDGIAGETLIVNIPEIRYALHYKEDSDISDENQNYFDDNVPFKGWVIDYMDAILELSNIGSFNYTHTSFGSKAILASNNTAAVSDVKAGISDVVASSVWITTERLSMSPYTVETASDKLYLWVESPEVVTAPNIGKVFSPFDISLWLCLAASVILVSLLSL